MRKNIQKMKEKLSISEQSSNYILQYRDAIMILLNSEKIDDHIYPLINLIHQYIELFLKDLILDYDIEPFTAIEMKVVTHNLKVLLKDEFFYKEEFKDMDFFNNNYLVLKKNVEYFSNILGKSTFFNSRYPTAKDKNLVSIPNFKISVLKIKENFQQLNDSISNIMYVFAAEKFLDSILIDFRFNELSFTKNNFDNTIELFLNDILFCEEKDKFLIKKLMKELYINVYSRNLK